MNIIALKRMLIMLFAKILAFHIDGLTNDRILIYLANIVRKN